MLVFSNFDTVLLPGSLRLNRTFVSCGRLIQFVRRLFLNIYRQELSMHPTSRQCTKLRQEWKAI
jgi:hypothetical protein